VPYIVTERFGRLPGEIPQPNHLAANQQDLPCGSQLFRIRNRHDGSVLWIHANWNFQRPRRGLRHPHAGRHYGPNGHNQHWSYEIALPEIRQLGKLRTAVVNPTSCTYCILI